MTAAFEADLARLAGFLKDASSAVALTGAGISTESGISDFRSPGGVWSRQKPVPFQEFLASREARRRWWAMRRESYREIAAARPNRGHLALADLQARGRLRALITQNIDRLHQMAGSAGVIELHGNAREILCLECGNRYAAEDIQLRLEAGDEVPACADCGGILKSATISFGQPLPQEALEESQRLCLEADLFLAIGSSLTVTPAAVLPEVARRNGSRLVIINRDETPLDHLADLIIRESIGEVLEAAAKRVG